jgi:hypothetical protein
VNVMWTHKKSTAFLLGLLLIDLPVLIVVIRFGVVYGFGNTYGTISEWRLEHPWSMVPSVMLAAWLIRKRVKS